MKIEELRAGNWYKWGKVGSISCYQVNREDFTKNFIDYAVGIPLTEEILLKCGFEKIGNFIFIELDNGVKINSIFGYCRLTIDIYGNRCSLFHIKYIHQLQNLYFALTGQELNIKL